MEASWLVSVQDTAKTSLNYTLKQILKNCKTQKWDHNHWRVFEITRILMYVSIPRDFEFQRNLHLQFPPFWIQILLTFLESSVKMFNKLWNSTLKNRNQLWHLRFDLFFILKYRDFSWTRSKNSHFGEKIYGLIHGRAFEGLTLCKLYWKKVQQNGRQLWRQSNLFLGRSASGPRIILESMFFILKKGFFFPLCLQGKI